MSHESQFDKSATFRALYHKLQGENNLAEIFEDKRLQFSTIPRDILDSCIKPYMNYPIMADEEEKERLLEFAKTFQITSIRLHKFLTGNYDFDAIKSFANEFKQHSITDQTDEEKLKRISYGYQLLSFADSYISSRVVLRHAANSESPALNNQVCILALLFKILDQLGECPSPAQYVLSYAVRSQNRLINNIDFISEMISLGARVNCEIRKEIKFDYSSHNYAYLMRKLNYPRATQTHRRLFAFPGQFLQFFPYAAYTYCDIPMLEYLFDQEMDFKAPHQLGNPFLFHMVNFSCKTVEFLLRKGTIKEDPRCEMALQVFNGYWDVDLTAYPDIYLERYAAMNNQIDAVMVLISKGANKHLALLTAAQYGHNELVGILIDAGALPQGEATDYYSVNSGIFYTPITLALMSGHVACAQLLYNKGATIDGLTSITFACTSCSKDGMPIETHNFSLSPLMCAVIAGQKESVRFLLDNNVDMDLCLDVRDSPESDDEYHKEATALSLAARFGDNEIVAMLIAKVREIAAGQGVELSYKNRLQVLNSPVCKSLYSGDYLSGYHPLLMAVIDNNFRAIKVFLEVGVDPYIFISSNRRDDRIPPHRTARDIYIYDNGEVEILGDPMSTFEMATTPEVYDFICDWVRNAQFNDEKINVLVNRQNQPLSNLTIEEENNRLLLFRHDPLKNQHDLINRYILSQDLKESFNLDELELLLYLAVRQNLMGSVRRLIAAGADPFHKVSNELPHNAFEHASYAMFNVLCEIVREIKFGARRISLVTSAMTHVGFFVRAPLVEVASPVIAFEALTAINTDSFELDANSQISKRSIQKTGLDGDVSKRDIDVYPDDNDQCPGHSDKVSCTVKFTIKQ